MWRRKPNDLERARRRMPVRAGPGERLKVSERWPTVCAARRPRAGFLLGRTRACGTFSNPVPATAAAMRAQSARPESQRQIAPRFLDATRAQARASFIERCTVCASCRRTNSKGNLALSLTAHLCRPGGAHATTRSAYGVTSTCRVPGRGMRPPTGGRASLTRVVLTASRDVG